MAQLTNKPPSQFSWQTIRRLPRSIQMLALTVIWRLQGRELTLV